jgi:hypothetical protein
MLITNAVESPGGEFSIAITFYVNLEAQSSGESIDLIY